MNAQQPSLRLPQQFRAAALLGAVLFAASACSSDSNSETQASLDSTSTTAVESAPVTDPVSPSNEVQDAVQDVDPSDSVALVSIDGVDPFEIEVSACSASGESTVAFSGESSEGTSVSVDATDMVGGVFIDGPEASFEGTVDLVMVGDTGQIVIGANGSEADHTSEGGIVEISIEGFVCS